MRSNGSVMTSLMDNRKSIILTDNDSLWLTYSDHRDEEVMTVSSHGQDMMTPLSPGQPPMNEWYAKPCLPHRGGMMPPSMPVEHIVTIPAQQQPHGQCMAMVSSEPHYSVPRNNALVTQVTPLSTDHETDHIGSGQTTDQYPQYKQEAEMDKTPTNEAGKMMDLLETVKKHLNNPFFSENIFKNFTLFSWT